MQIKRIVEKGLGHLFITSGSSHFFNKTHFEQYLLFSVSNGNHSNLSEVGVLEILQQKENYHMHVWFT